MAMCRTYSISVRSKDYCGNVMAAHWPNLNGLCKYPPPRVYSLNAIRSTIIDFPATERDPAFSVGIAGDRDDFSRRFRDQKSWPEFSKKIGQPRSAPSLPT